MGKSRETKSNQTQQQKVDPALVAESEALINLFRVLASGGFQPNRGVTIAAPTPKQEAAYAMGDQLANAFGFTSSGPSPLPETEQSALGIAGYRPATEYDAMAGALPPEYQAMMDEFYSMISNPTEKPVVAATPSRRNTKPGLYVNPITSGRKA